MNPIKRVARNIRNVIRRRTLPAHLRQADATQGMLAVDEMALLYERARSVTHGCIVEVGSYRGRSTVALAAGSMAGTQAPIYAIEPHEVFEGVLGGSFGPEDRAAFYRAMLRTSSYQVVRLVNLSSEIVAGAWDKPIGFLWIDGDHSYEGVKRDFQSWAPHCLDDAHIAFHDSMNPDLGPRQLIDELVQSKEYEQVQCVVNITELRKSKKS